VEHCHSAPPRNPGALAVLAALEEQLAALDEMGAHIAAAHLDAAIQQLRLDQARGLPA
jgi:hypothetical protein